MHTSKAAESHLPLPTRSAHGAMLLMSPIGGSVDTFPHVLKNISFLWQQQHRPKVCVRLQL